MDSSTATVSHLFHTTSTTSNKHFFAISSTANIHTTPSLLLAQLTSPLYSLATLLHSPLPVHNYGPSARQVTFPLSIPTSKTASGKVIKRTFTFDVTLTEAPSEVTGAPSEASVALTITTPPSPPTPNFLSNLQLLSPALYGEPPPTLPLAAPPPLAGEFTLTPAPHDTTTLTLTLSLPTAGSGSSVETALQHKAILNHFHHPSTGVIPTLYEAFAAPNLISSRLTAAFTSAIPNASPLTPPEATLLTLSLTYDDSDHLAALARGANAAETFMALTADNVDHWQRLPTTPTSPFKMWQKRSDSGESAWGKAVAHVDTSALTAFANIYVLDTPDKIQAASTSYRGGGFRHVRWIPGGRGLIYLTLLKLPSPVADRVVCLWWTWRREDDGAFVVAFEGIDSPRFADFDTTGELRKEVDSLIDNDSAARRAVRGESKGFWRIEPRGDKNCEITYVLQGRLNGNVPKYVVDSRVHLQLRRGCWEIQEKYEREPTIIDEEMRSLWARKGVTKLEALSSEQKKVVKRAKQLEVGSGVIKFRHIAKTPFLTASMRTKDTTALGRASVLVDADQITVAAERFMFMSRGRVRLFYEKGGLARTNVRVIQSDVESVEACVLSMGRFLQPREFIFKTVVCEDGNGDIILSSVSMQELVDYGTDVSCVRGVSKAFVRISKVENAILPQCKVTYFQHLDLGGFVPHFFVKQGLPMLLSEVADVRNLFQRDIEIDRAGYSALSELIAEPQTYTPEENTLLEEVVKKLTSGKQDDFEELDSPDHLSPMSVNLHNATRGIGRCTTIVDATISECAAFEMHLTSRENSKATHELTILKTITEVNDHHSIVQQVRDDLRGVPGFIPRQFLSRLLWKWTNEYTFVCAYVNIDKHEDYPVRKLWMRGEANSCWIFEKLSPVGDTPQTRATFTASIDMKGAIPRSVMSRAGPAFLSVVIRLRKLFDKSDEIDRVVRAKNLATIDLHSDHAYSDEERTILKEGLSHFAFFNTLKAKNLKISSHSSTAKVAYKKTDHDAWGLASSPIRASANEVMAFLLDPTRRMSRKEGDLEKSLDESPNDHNQLVYKKRRMAIISDREFLSRRVWSRNSDGSFLLAGKPAESERRPNLSRRGSVRRPSGAHHREHRVVRGEMCFAFMIVPKGERECVVEYVINPHMGGSVPFWLAKAGMKSQLSKVVEIQKYFQSHRTVSEWDASDGVEIGELMVLKTKNEKHLKKGESRIAARLRELFRSHNGMREIGERYPFFEPMMVRVVQNKLALATEVGSKLCNVSNREGRLIGSGLAMSVATYLTPESGVDEFILRYKSLKELDQNEVFFRPMINHVARRLLGEVSWGLKMRVLTGAGLSILDMASDAYIGFKFLQDEHKNTRLYGYILVGMILMSILGQLVFVVIQNRRVAPLKLAKEMFIVLTGLKPGWDAGKVTMGVEMEEHHLFDARLELNLMKAIELCFESIPGCILTTHYLLTRKFEFGAVVSIGISALTTGFVSASVSFDCDVDPSARKKDPAFYGYIPDGGSRTVIFACMMLNSSALLLMRSFTAALLLLTDTLYLWAYLGGDMLGFLTFKTVTGDFHHWIPVDGLSGRLLSLLMKCTSKIIVDYTGLLHLRSPQEIGAVPWTTSMGVAVFAAMAALRLNFEHANTESTVLVKGTVMGGMIGTWLVTFLLIILLMKKEYRGSFWNWTRGKDMVMARFRSENEEFKASLLTKNNNMWWTIREDVRDWVQSNWWRWKEEKPEWMTDSWIAKVPKDWIPVEDKQEVDVVRKKERRRGSLLGELKVHRGSVYASGLGR